MCIGGEQLDLEIEKGVKGIQIGHCNKYKHIGMKIS